MCCVLGSWQAAEGHTEWQREQQRCLHDLRLLRLLPELLPDTALLHEHCTPSLSASDVQLLTASRPPPHRAGTIAFVSGATAAVGSSVVKVPIAVCIRSVQAGVYPNVVMAAKSITRVAGPRGLFTVSCA